MPVFKLADFPNVCRLCLVAPEGKLVSLRTRDPVFDGGTIGDFITRISFKIEQHKAHLFPQVVCQPCFDLLKFFARYRTKVANVHLLMNALVELRFSNCRPLVDLFERKQSAMEVLLKDVGVCEEVEDATAQTLMEEFPTYAIASVERADEIDVVEPVCDDVVESERPAVRRVKRKVPVQKVVVKRVKRVKAVESTPDETVESSVEPAEIDQGQSDEIDQPIAQEDDRHLKEIKLQYKLRCTKCTYTTEYLREFEAHQLIEHEIKSREFHCDKPGCPEVFKDAYLLYKHNVKMHKPYVCDICGTGLSSRSDLKDHMARHKNDQNFACTYCDRRFNLKQDLGTHIRRIHLSEKNFECKTCGLKFTSNYMLKTHSETHNVDKSYACQTCGKKFKSSENLKSHRIIYCDQVKLRHECSHCDKRYPSRTKLIDHIESVHRIKCRFPCDVCVQPFTNPEEMATHRLRHDNPKELECGRCLVAFLSAEDMAAHLCITYQDNYFCCGRDFRYHYAYNKHMFIKHGQKTNARVRPNPDELLGLSKLRRKRIEMCHKCETVFPTRAKKQRHQETCTGPPAVAPEASTNTAQDEPLIPMFNY
ncbi:hypothetical protein quinque_003912 [Culex quinquefasciatus]